MVKKGVRDMSDRETAFRNKISIAACVALAVVMVSAADLYTGFRERTEVNVAEGTTLQHAGLMLQSAESAVNKTGKGTWQVPVESIRQIDAFDFRVREGTLSLTTGGTAPTVAKPTELLNRAIFWLSTKDDVGDRSAKLVVSNGEDNVTYVTRWCDERETDTETPTRYYMECDWGDPNYGSRQGTNVVYMVTNGIPSVWFGGYNSGQMLRLREAETNSFIQNIRHIFWVNGQYTRNAYVIGNCDHGGTASTTTTTRILVCLGKRTSGWATIGGAVHAARACCSSTVRISRSLTQRRCRPGFTCTR